MSYPPKRVQRASVEENVIPYVADAYLDMGTRRGLEGKALGQYVNKKLDAARELIEVVKSSLGQTGPERH